MSGVSPMGPGGPGPQPPAGGNQQPWLGAPPPAQRYGPPPGQPYPPRQPPGYPPPGYPAPVRPARTGGGVPSWVGWLLAVPFVLGWIFWLVVPTVRTITMSFQNVAVLHGSNRGVGGRNYSGLGGAGFWSALGHTVALAVVPVLVIGIVAPLLAFAVNRGSSGVRMAARLALTVPVAGFAPAIVLVAWRLLLSPTGALSGLLDFHSSLDTSVTMQVVTALAWLGLLCGIGLAIYLAAMRRRDQDTLPPLPAGQAVRRIGAVWVLAVLGTLAFSLQAFTLTYGLTRGGQGSSTAQLVIFDTSFHQLRLGLGAAGGTVLLVLLVLLGVGAGLVVTLSRLRIELDARRAIPGASRTPGAPGSPGFAGTPGGTGTPGFAGTPGGPGFSGGAGFGAAVRRPVAVLGIVGLVLALLIAVLDLVQRLGVFEGHGTGRAPGSPGGLLLYTLVPPLLGTLVLVPLAYLGGVGIGGLRPAGRRSEWLLMPFAPWLFVTAGPLSAALFWSAYQDHALNTLLGLVPPLLASVPALYVFALFSAGQARHWQALPPARRGFGALLRVQLLPALPLIGLVALVSLLLGAADVYWPLLMASDSKVMSGPLNLLFTLVSFSASGPHPAAVVLAAPVSIVALVGLIALQLTYLPRLALRTGPDTPTDTTPTTAPSTAPAQPSYPTDPATVRLPTPPTAPPPPPGYGPPPTPGPVAPGPGPTPPHAPATPPWAQGQYPPPPPGHYPPPGQPPGGHYPPPPNPNAPYPPSPHQAAPNQAPPNPNAPNWVMPNQAPGQAPGQAPSQAPGQWPGQGPGQATSQMPGQWPGQASGQMPGQAPSQTPGQAPGQIPGQMPGQAPSQTPGQAHGQTPGQMPGQAPGQGQGSGETDRTERINPPEGPLPPGR